MGVATIHEHDLASGDRVCSLDEMTDQGIEVSRVHAWADGRATYRILIDGERAGNIGDGETIRVPTSVGVHRFQLRVQLAGSPTVSINVPTERYVKVVARPPAGWVGAWKTLQSLWRRDRYLLLEVVG